MKIKVSRSFFITEVFTTIVVAIFNIAILPIMLPYSTKEDYIYGLCLPLLFFLAPIFIGINIRKALLTVVINDDMIYLKRGKKIFCSLSLKSDLYYMLFVDKEDVSTFSKFIIISAEPIIYNNNVGLIKKYDTKKQIVIPYNEKTKKCLLLSDWTECKLDKSKKVSWWNKGIGTAYDWPDDKQNN